MENQKIKDLLFQYSVLYCDYKGQTRLIGKNITSKEIKDHFMKVYKGLMCKDVKNIYNIEYIKSCSRTVYCDAYRLLYAEIAYDIYRIITVDFYRYGRLYTLRRMLKIKQYLIECKNERISFFITKFIDCKSIGNKTKEVMKSIDNELKYIHFEKDIEDNSKNEINKKSNDTITQLRREKANLENENNRLQKDLQKLTKLQEKQNKKSLIKRIKQIFNYFKSL